MAERTCITEGCGRTGLVGRGYCAKCYQREWDIHREEWKAEGRPSRPVIHCSIEGCGKVQKSLGYCLRHYTRLKRWGDPLGSAPKPGTRNTCEVEGCGRQTRNRTGKHCRLHIQRQRAGRGVGPAGLKQRPKGSGSVNAGGYVMHATGGSRIYEHRRVMAELIGRPLETFEHVHHINGIRTDNRPENLQLWVSHTRALGVSGQQPFGVNVDDLVAFVVRQYPERVAELMVRQNF